MAALAGTTWVLTLCNPNESVMGNFTMEFKTDGTAIMSAPNGQKSTVYFTESGGDFIIQSPKSTNNPNIINIYAGSQKVSAGIGISVGYQGNKDQTIARPFTMVKK